MRMSMIPIIIWILVAGCNLQSKTSQIDVEDRVYCSEPRPDVCATVYDPVCASNGKTYSSSCNACADRTVDYSDVGVCSGDARNTGESDSQDAIY